MIQDNSRNALALAVVLAIGVGPAGAQTTTITGSAGSDDSWNDATNWDAGVPSAALDAVVSSGVFAQAGSVSTPLYTGSLTLSAGSILKMHCASGGSCGVGPENAVEGASVIYMHVGSEIHVNMNVNVNFPPITLLGDARMISLFGASDWQTDNLSAITGAHTLTLKHFNGHVINLNAANGFSALIADTLDRWYLHANAAGSLGTGNVTVNPRADGRSASLFIDADNAMADTATLTLNGTIGQGGFSGNGSDYLVMNANDTIAALNVWGVSLPNGTYTNSEAWLDGPGTLTVNGVGIGYCTSNVNSTGGAAMFSAGGSDSISANNLTLHSSPVPNQPGLFFYGANQVQLPFGNGFLCVQGQMAYLYPPVWGVSNEASHAIDYASLPAGSQITAGSTWNFQHWYRDPAAGGAAFNSSNGLAVTFTP